jgi:hypothetical protein
MNNEYLDNLDEKTFNILEYVRKNFVGLILLLFAFFIIYFVDYINRLNTIIYSLTPTTPNLQPMTTQKMSKRKFKKH